MRIFPVIVGVIIGLGVLVVLERAAETQPKATLVSDVDGPLAEVSIHYCESFHDASFQTIGDFVSQLHPRVVVDVVVERKEEFLKLQHELELAYRDPLPQLRPVVTGVAITPWSKDRYATMISRRHPVLAVPSDEILGERVAGRGDTRVPSLLAHDGIERRELPFRFDGGDLICTRERLFMAATCLARNQPYDDAGREALLHTMSEAFGKPITLLGDHPEEVPPHHIGMYLTPLGGQSVMVGDPDLGLKLYRESGGDVATLPTEDATLKPFRNVIRLLEEKGFTVMRLPLVVTSEPQVYMTYNNGVAEVWDGKKYFYMPVYGVPALDDAAAACYASCGYNVKRVRVKSLYRYTGSLRCLVGIVHREEKRDGPAVIGLSQMLCHWLCSL